MCKIKQIVERDEADSHLNEAVMEDAERELVNKFGFCKHHYDLLYAGSSKLGLALQLSTRLNKIIKMTKTPKTAKEAEKLAKTLHEKTESCIICNKIEFNMKRYFETVPRLYHDDKKFREQNFESIKGFCYPHYIRLLENAKKAGKYSEQFLKTLSEKQLTSLEQLKTNVDEFTMAFDYRSKGNLPKEVASSLKTARVKLYGELSLPPERK